MIAETLQQLATLPLTGKPFRRFVRSSVSLWSRAGRCRQAWAEHERHSQKAVLDAMADLTQRRTAVVLGSGLLRDVPIVELAQAFDRVVLVDLVHLASVRLWLKARRLGNVRLIERDLSGYDQLTAGKGLEPLGFLRQVPYLDLVVSANLLSQIGRGVQRRLSDDRKGIMPADAAARLVGAHLADLAVLPCRSCLVTDIAYAVIDRTGKIHEQADLLLGIAPPEAIERWTWPVAPLGEESRDYQIVHQVIAARLSRR
ncbi:MULTISPECIES: hypothetical protein [Rhizobium]|uniref:Class I SAM-dependent methyltransferase n=1 Tax=Rhizobium rhododendri TaxID=2506430 RepID=A0ABY8IIU2_9HYPH|nr:MULTISPECIES: hypothetical protein [Rhizobium]TQX89927.1 hypothetical protein EQW76_09300 [Rhizobium sp. rho-13.1]TQY15878.1 hypothetical protein EQW74_08890 [Rhizobium sp. rho-1.1]WFS23257.1 hypothetical protein PR018_01645 [Rhizobium rhododendri]